jgi:hypothetical protein
MAAGDVDEARYRRKGDPMYEAVLVEEGEPESKYRFVTGPWKGEVILVENWKMLRVVADDSSV